MNKKPTFCTKAIFFLILSTVTFPAFCQVTSLPRSSYSSQWGLISEHQTYDSDYNNVYGLCASMQFNFRLIDNLHLSTNGAFFESFYFGAGSPRGIKPREMSGVTLQMGLQYQLTEFSNLFGLIADAGFSYLHGTISSETIFGLPSYTTDLRGYYLAIELRIKPLSRFSVGLISKYARYPKNSYWILGGFGLNFKLW